MDEQALQEHHWFCDQEFSRLILADLPCEQLVKSLLCWLRFDEPRGHGHNENQSTPDEVPLTPLSPSPQYHVLVAMKLCLESLDAIRGRTQMEGYIKPLILQKSQGILSIWQTAKGYCSRGILPSLDSY